MGGKERKSREGSVAAVRGVRGPEGVRSEAGWLVTWAPRASGAALESGEARSPGPRSTDVCPVTDE